MNATGDPVDVSTPAATLANMDAIREYLVKADPTLELPLSESTLDWDRFVKTPFVAVVGAIVGRVVRYGRARTVRERMYDHLGGVLFGADELGVLLKDEARCRAIGLSGTAVATLDGLCAHVARHGHPSTADDVRRLRLDVEGIGQWVVDSALLTSLLDADVFPSGDKWIRRKMADLAGLTREPTPKEATAMAAVWSPYRGVAAAYLWRWFSERESKALGLD